MAGTNLVRAGAAAAISGAVVLLAATVLHPLDADPGDAIAAFSEYAADRHWVATHLGQLLGVLLITFALVALHDDLRADGGAWLARLGLVAAVASLCATAILQAVDGVALKIAVDRWASASPSEQRGAFEAAFAVRQVEVGVASVVAILFGVTVALYGLAIAASRGAYPRLLGWLAVVGGAGTLVGGLMTAHGGFSRAAMTLAMPFNLLLVVWMLAVGVFMWRRASRSG